MLDARVVEIDLDEKTVGRGEHRFLQLPCAGDRIVLPSRNGDIDVMSVRYIEHSPQWLDGMKASAIRSASATIYVRFHRGDP